MSENNERGRSKTRIRLEVREEQKDRTRLTTRKSTSRSKEYSERVPSLSLSLYVYTHTVRMFTSSSSSSSSSCVDDDDDDKKSIPEIGTNAMGNETKRTSFLHYKRAMILNKIDRFKRTPFPFFPCSSLSNLAASGLAIVTTNKPLLFF
jgi:hypothetical protein